MGHKYVNKIITMTVQVNVTIVLMTNLPIWHHPPSAKNSVVECGPNRLYFQAKPCCWPDYTTCNRNCQIPPHQKGPGALTIKAPGGIIYLQQELDLSGRLIKRSIYITDRSGATERSVRV